jgi:hypothetical protein
MSPVCPLSGVKRTSTSAWAEPVSAPLPINFVHYRRQVPVSHKLSHKKKHSTPVAAAPAEHGKSFCCKRDDMIELASDRVCSPTRPVSAPAFRRDTCGCACGGAHTEGQCIPPTCRGEGLALR